MASKHHNKKKRYPHHQKKTQAFMHRLKSMSGQSTKKYVRKIKTKKKKRKSRFIAPNPIIEQESPFSVLLNNQNASH